MAVGGPGPALRTWPGWPCPDGSVIPGLSARPGRYRPVAYPVSSTYASPPSVFPARVAKTRWEPSQ